MPYRMRAIKVGENRLPPVVGRYLAFEGEWDTYVFYMWLLQGEGHTVIINTGLPEDLEPANRHWESYAGPEARARVEPGEKPGQALDRLGVDPAAVDTVIITPLVGYSTGNLSLFPRARLCFLRSGWEDYFSPRLRPYNDPRRDFDLHPAQRSYVVNEAWDRVRLLEDEDEVLPGIRTWFSGAHHRSSMAVEVDTSRGQAIYTDSYFFYRNLEANEPIGVLEDIFEAFRTMERIRRTADIPLPGFDPQILERHAEGIIA